MTGPLIYGFSEDAVAAAKVMADFAKSNDKLVDSGGAYAGKALDADGVKALASIPTKEVLLAQLLGLMQSPGLAYGPCAGRVGREKRRSERSRPDGSRRCEADSGLTGCSGTLSSSTPTD